MRVDSNTILNKTVLKSNDTNMNMNGTLIFTDVADKKTDFIFTS